MVILARLLSATKAGYPPVILLLLGDSPQMQDSEPIASVLAHLGTTLEKLVIPSLGRVRHTNINLKANTSLRYLEFDAILLFYKRYTNHSPMDGLQR